MRYKSLEREKPLAFELEGLEIGLTSNCNFSCEYCCAYRRDDGQSLTGSEVVRILEELPALKRVRLSGGEVTLKWRDCLEVVAYCASRGLSTQLNTNASLLNEKRIGQLENAGLSHIHISFNFTSADAFAAYYKLSPRIYERIVENIRLSAVSGIETVLETLLFSETQHHLKAISDEVYRLGVRIHEIQNSIRMEHNGWSAVAARDALPRTVQELIAGKRPDSTLIFTCMDRFAESLGLCEQPGVLFANCVDGKTQLHLHGNGDILICELCHPVVIGNIYDGTSLATIYQNKPAALAEFLQKLPCPALEAVASPKGFS